MTGTLWERPVSAFADGDVSQLRSAIDAATDMIFVTDDVPASAGGPFIQYANEAMAREFGVTPDDLTGISPAFLFGPRTDRGTVERMRAAMDAMRDAQGEFRAYRIDGSSFWSDWRGRGIPATASRAACWIAIGRNTDERRRAEDRLTMLSTAIDHANDAVFVYGIRTGDDRPRMRYVNPAGMQHSGYSEAELLAGASRRGPLTEPGLHEDVVAAMTAGRPMCKRLCLYRKDGSHYWAGVHFQPIRDRTGDYTQWMCVERDITDDVERERARTDLMAMIGHDLRNPLTSILGCAELLIEALPPGDANRAAVEHILNAGRRLESLAYELLTDSRSERTSAGPTIADVDVAALVADVVAYMPGGERIEIAAPLPLIVRSDSVAIRHTLENLLGNALKFSAPPAHVAVSLEDAGNGIVMRVADAGIGIPADELPHVFDRAKRGTNVGPRRGSGLGLCFVKQMVASLAGQVTATSIEGLGSTFEVRLPNIA